MSSRITNVLVFKSPVERLARIGLQDSISGSLVSSGGVSATNVADEGQQPYIAPDEDCA